MYERLSRIAGGQAVADPLLRSTQRDSVRVRVAIKKAYLNPLRCLASQQARQISAPIEQKQTRVHEDIDVLAGGPDEFVPAAGRYRPAVRVDPQ